jgi:hypothetical protein
MCCFLNRSGEGREGAPMLVRVTRKHIEAGIPYNARWCPIACALEDKGFEDVLVNEQYAFVDTKVYLMTKRGQAFIKRFDRRLHVRPITLNLRKERT